MIKKPLRKVELATRTAQLEEDRLQRQEPRAMRI
jgi:hypothetical protein